MDSKLLSDSRRMLALDERLTATSDNEMIRLLSGSADTCYCDVTATSSGRRLVEVVCTFAMSRSCISHDGIEYADFFYLSRNILLPRFLMR